MGRQVFLFELDGKQVMGFDTGLDARAFARAKLAQLVTEHGMIVRPGDAGNPGSVELWKASGVIEYAGDDKAQPPTMVVWGPAFEGERLDLMVNDSARQDEALSAIALWLRAVLTLEEKSLVSVPLWPCAAIVASAQVFFAPPTLALRCLRADHESLHFSGYEWYVHPDFGGTELVQDQHSSTQPDHLARHAYRPTGSGKNQFQVELAKANKRAAFTAATMLYRVIAGVPPFNTTNDITLHQDMRDGNFLPIRLAVPGLDGRLADLIQRVLSPQGKRNVVTGIAMEKPLSSDLLAAIQLPPPGEALPLEAALPSEAALHTKETATRTSLAASISSLVLPVSEADRLVLEKEKNQFLKIKTASVNTKRFVIRNAGILAASLAILGFLVFVFSTIVNSRAARPTTEGMYPIQVVESFYNAFGELDHHLMENIVLRGVGRNDINTVTHLFVINRVRMAHEFSPTPLIISAMEWQGRGGGETHLAVFGVTDLQIEEIERGRELGQQERRTRRNRAEEEEVHFRVDYMFWVPAQMLSGPPDARADARITEVVENPLPVAFRHTDLVSLVRRQGNWRISDITRIRY